MGMYRRAVRKRCGYSKDLFASDESHPTIILSNSVINTLARTSHSRSSAQTVKFLE